jgi:hypothetical protein
MVKAKRLELAGLDHDNAGIQGIEFIERFTK